jgi:asparagine synthase (glutamine-hydrolysing)
MCGICGIVSYGSPPPVQDELSAMCSTIEHRGPDGTRIDIRGRIGFGHTRLSVIDLETGWQPISNESGSVRVICNGEIYNFRELRQQLQDSGHRFSTNSDTETIVHLYEDDGLRFVRRLNGMFAIALWDEDRQRLVLARDRIGKKPLYYSDTGSEVVFASEVKAIAANGRAQARVDPVSLDTYLTYGWIPAPRSIYRDIKKVAPATVMWNEDGKWQSERYWDLQFTGANKASVDELAEEVWLRVREATKRRLVSDVPLGYLLSGGVDSGAIVSAAADQSSERIKTFSIGFDNRSFDELPQAALVAKRYETDHHELTVETNISDTLDQAVWASDEPMADSSSLPMYLVSQLTRASVTVALTGDGGDEAFSGYRRYYGIRFADWYNKVPKSIRKRVFGPLAQRLPESGQKIDRASQIKRFTQPATAEPEERYAGWFHMFPTSLKGSIYSDKFVSILDNEGRDPDPMLTAFGKATALDRTQAAQWVDTMTYLPSDLMVKADRMSMAHGLELRSPFLDHELLEFAATIPTSLKVRGFKTKWILKKAFEKDLPPEITNRPKEGFTPPVADWIRGELRESTEHALLSSDSSVSKLFRREYLQRLFDDHLASKAESTNRIWTLLCLESWSRQFSADLI